MSINIGNKYGCLTVLDLGEEYTTTQLYKNIMDEYISLSDNLKKICNASSITEKREIIESTNASGSFFMDLRKNPDNVENIYSGFVEHRKHFDEHKITNLKNKLETIHYKCRCDKCGKIHYYNEKALLTNPKYCFYPVIISDNQRTKSYKNKDKYLNLENVDLKYNSEEIDNNIYCEAYKKYKENQLKKKEKAHILKLQSLPRIYAENYNIDFTGKTYESLYINKCIDAEAYRFIGYSKRELYEVCIYSKYECTCKLCGKKYIVPCDYLIIHPPTQYGYRAYGGYWSEIYCDCHPVSSFQWIINKILFENNVNYEVEYKFKDLYSFDNKGLLRFDFAIKDDNNNVVYLIECQGEQHYYPVEEFGGKVAYDKQVKNDELKRAYCQKHNIPLLEISYKNKKYDSVMKILIENKIIKSIFTNN